MILHNLIIIIEYDNDIIYETNVCWCCHAAMYSIPILSRVSVSAHPHPRARARTYTYTYTYTLSV